MDEAAKASQPPTALPSFVVPGAIALAILEVAIDWGTWIELNVAILYGLPLVLAAMARNRKLLWGLAAVLVFVTFGVYVAQVDGGEEAMRGSFLADRLLAATSILLTAAILHARMRSIEELDRRRQELEQVSMRKTQMLASLSHDIRTPIQAITLLSELVRRTAERPELAGKIPALAQRLQSNAVSVVDFLSEVIDVASFDAGRVSVNTSEFSLEALLAEQCQRLLPLADEKKLQLAVRPPPQPVWLRTDRVKLGRVISNLVSNAIKFTEQGSVTIEGVLCREGVAIRVVDTGCGMKPEHLEQVFGEYAQFDRDPSLAGSSWGLGLAISRRMVRLLGGEISVESELRKGSTFTVMLPAATVAEGHDAAS